MEVKYWNPRSILGYNAKWNIVLSGRGPGKTYSTSRMLIDGKDAFMCLYRDTADLQYAVDAWSDLVIDKMTSTREFEWVMESDHVDLMENGRLKGAFRALGQANHIKHEVFPDNLCWVWFDEFIPMVKRKLRGVLSEGEALETIVKTIEHDSVQSRADKGLKPVRVLMYGNPFTWDSELLRYFQVMPTDYGIHRVKNDLEGETVMEYIKPTAGMQGLHIQEGWKKQLSFVEPVGKGAVPIWSVRVGTGYYVAYKREKDIWVVRGEEHVNLSRIGARLGAFEGLQMDELPVSKVRAKMMIEWTKAGRLKFSDLNTKLGWINDMEELV